MPKKSTGYTPTGKIKDSPVAKEAVPFKNPSIKPLSQPLAGGPNMVAKLGKPQKFGPKKPSTKGM